MCLGIPGRVIEVCDQEPVRMAKVSFEGVVRKVCMEHVRDAEPGDYVLVHVGFALSKIDEAEARRVFAMLEELPALDERNDAHAAAKEPIV